MTSQANPASRGFFNHAGLTFARDAKSYTGIDNYQKNILERVGDGFMWHVTELPRYVKNLVNEPRFLVVVFTAIGLYSVQFAFYPRPTIEYIKLALQYLPGYLKHAKVVAYAASMIGMAGWGLRAYGRVSNSELMNKWYTKASA